MTHRKKLIEVALPLDAINKASAREKSIRHGHPSTLHLWWARRPLAAARAVIFAQMVDDPSTYVDILRSDSKKRRKAESELKKRLKEWNEAKRIADLAANAEMSAPPPGPEPTLDDILAELERERLFNLIEELVQWENTNNETVLQKARDEIWQSWRRACADNADHPRAKELFDRDKLPAFHDPFAGGGALPLEAQRLGLESYASDLNPVAVLINKAMIEIPFKFAGLPPVNPEARREQSLVKRTWKGAEGLAEDVRYYGKWMRDEAEKRIGHLYPKVEVTAEMAKQRTDLKPYVGKSLTVIAWIWARTVKSPNPAFAHVDVPLTSTFMLSTKAGKEAYVEPMIEKDNYRFRVKVGIPEDLEKKKKGTKLSRANFQCILSGTPITAAYIKAEGKAGRMNSRLIAIVAQGKRGRVYLEPNSAHEFTELQAEPEWSPDVELAGKCRDQFPLYGMSTFTDLYTKRQLVALNTLSKLVSEAREQVRIDWLKTVAKGVDGCTEGENGIDFTSYSTAIGVYLGFQVDQVSNHLSKVCAWHVNNEQLKNTFARQALPMTWDYAETNVLSNSTGSLANLQERQVKGIKSLPASASEGFAVQSDACKQVISKNKIVSTDPPYYDNICYADLSDFFYVWLRRNQKACFPKLFSTLAAPKAEELVATVYRHGTKVKAEEFFLHGMTQAMQRLAKNKHPYYPVTIYYAFKQSETEITGGTASTGWETFLDALINAGFVICGTWPIRTEQTAAIKTSLNVLASSIVLVCRSRLSTAPVSTRKEFVAALKTELPVALTHLQRGNIAPADLAQAAIGPGMAIFSRYAKVIDTDGKIISVRSALKLINYYLDEVLTEQEGDFDSDTRWALAWFEQFGFADGEYGVAEILSKAKNTSVQGMTMAGIILSKVGKVRLLKPKELSEEWDPATDHRLTVWEVAHQLLRALDQSELAAAELVAKLGSRADAARDLAYRLYTICERKKWPQDALAYNGLVQSWPEITRLAKEKKNLPKQVTIFDEE